ncbi:6329_t:CDS:1, partial [Funneliformis geosporum]
SVSGVELSRVGPLIAGHDVKLDLRQVLENCYCASWENYWCSCRNHYN